MKNGYSRDNVVFLASDSAGFRNSVPVELKLTLGLTMSQLA